MPLKRTPTLTSKYSGGNELWRATTCTPWCGGGFVVLNSLNDIQPKNPAFPKERRPVHPSTASGDEQVPRNPSRTSSVDADPFDITQTPEVQEVTPAWVLS